MTERMKWIVRLSEIETPGGGDLRQTIRHNGQTLTRTIKPMAALTVAAKLLRQETAGEPADAATMAQAKHLLQLAEWHPRQGGIKSPQTRRP